MAEEWVSSQLTIKTITLIRRIAEETGEKNYRVLERLLVAEAKRLGLPTDGKPKEK